MYIYVVKLLLSFKGPLTSFLDADPDLTKPQFTAYSSDAPSGGGASPKPHPHTSPTSSVGTSRRPKGARFTDAEIKVLRLAY